jgi:hypothetical protein
MIALPKQAALACKRVFDITVAGSALFVLSPALERSQGRDEHRPREKNRALRLSEQS